MCVCAHITRSSSASSSNHAPASSRFPHWKKRHTSACRLFNISSLKNAQLCHELCGRYHTHHPTNSLISPLFLLFSFLWYYSLSTSCTYNTSALLCWVFLSQLEKQGPASLQQILSPPKNIHFTGHCPIQTNIRAGKGIKNYSHLYSNWKQQSGAVPEISALCCTRFVLVMRLQPLLTIHSGHSPAGLIIALEWLWLSDTQWRHVWPVLSRRTNVLLTVCNIA